MYGIDDYEYNQQVLLGYPSNGRPAMYNEDAWAEMDRHQVDDYFNELQELDDFEADARAERERGKYWNQVRQAKAAKKKKKPAVSPSMQARNNNIQAALARPGVGTSTAQVLREALNDTANYEKLQMVGRMLQAKGNIPVRRDPIEEYKLQLGEEIRGFLVNKAANEGRMMIGDAQIMRTMPLTQMRGIYQDMLNRGYRRI